MNPNHDARGRFASKGSGSAGRKGKLAEANAKTKSSGGGEVIDLVHYTPERNVQSIKENGFRAGRGEAGYGAYFTPEGIDYPDRNYGDKVPVHVQFKAQKTLVMKSDKGDPGYQKYVDATLENYGRPDIPLSKLGYDSAKYYDPWGNVQFIVFDTSKIKIKSSGNSASRAARRRS